MKARERSVLILILALFVALGTTYSVVVPPFEASDELWHYPMVKYIADHWSLPVQEPGVETDWRQEGSQPPLYYVLMAGATFWIDTSDMEAVRHLNRHADKGVATPDGNVNLVVHHPEREVFPWRGTVLAIHLIRFLSILMGVAAVYLTYLIGRQVFPEHPALALGAAAVHAFTPMYVFISASVNNDNLVVPLSSLALLMLIRMSESASQRIGESASRRIGGLEDRQGSKWQTPLVRYLLLGVVLGLAALTKTSSLALTVLTALVVTMRAIRRRSWAEFFGGGLATLVPFLAVSGWWFLRNLRLYGDLTGLNVFIEVLGQRDVPADLAQLWRERYSFAAGYWGNFGGLNVPMPPGVYSVLNTILVVSALGLLLTLLRALACSSASPLLRSSVPLLLCLLWGLGVFVPWVWWARVTWSSQGRLVFTALPVWSLLLVTGLAGWCPRRWGKWVVAACAVFLLILSVVAPFAWIGPTYALPAPLTEAQVAAIPQRLNAEFGTASAGRMRLLGYGLEGGTVAAGGEVAVTLYWEALSPADRDYTVFVHLVNEQGLLVAQRDTYPGLGRLSTTWLEPGFRWSDRYVLQIPATVCAPDVAQVEVGLYDATTGVRLPATAADGTPLGDNVHFGEVRIRPRPGDFPIPVSVNFGNQMKLVGYGLDRRVVRPGETITLTLYWQGLRPMELDYTVSVQVVDVGQRKAAQRDGWPLDGTAPTSTWKAGRILTDPYALEIYPDAAPGVYNLRLTVYLFEEGEIAPLPTIPADGQMQATHVNLTTVRVEP